MFTSLGEMVRLVGALPVSLLPSSQAQKLTRAKTVLADYRATTPPTATQPDPPAN